MSKSSSNDEYDLIDIEEEIENFFVRKQGEPENAFPEKQQFYISGKEVHEYVPLLLRDVARLDAEKYVTGENFKIYHAFGGSVHFRCCILYARVLKKLTQRDPFNRYIVDDGTATLELNIYQRQEEMNANLLLRNEVAAMAKNCVEQSRREICNSLQRLLARAKEQIDTSSLPIGQKILVHGQPTCYKGQMRINSYSVCVDDGVSRDVEITFKDELLYWYTQIFAKARSKRCQWEKL